MVRRDLAAIPVERMKDSTAGRVRLGPLAAAGFTTVLDVLDAPEWALLAVPGVGQQTVTQIYGAARQVASAIEHGLKFRVDLDPTNQRSTALLKALHRLDAVHRAVEQVRPSVTPIGAGLATDIPVSVPTTGRLRWFFAGNRRKEQATASVARIARTLHWADENSLWHALDHVAAVAQQKPTAEQVWQDFERRSPEYYGLLGEIVDLKLDVADAEGFLPAEIVARVHEQELDETFRTVSLRGYQSFGARFSLVRRRVIIGDEMGLGKTIQAIAAMAHLRAIGGTHFLVVCPASVLINWMRELRARSTLTPYQLHGLERETNLRRWVSRKDVGVTTYESLRALAIPATVTIAMLVVDEAHYTKNPAAQRSRNVNEIARRADRVLFLTGTPMENRVEEFRNLIGYLQPHVVPHIQSHAVAGPDVFRKAVAPVYLRRNVEDVLSELPELIQVDEWGRVRVS